MTSYEEGRGEGAKVSRGERKEMKKTEVGGREDGSDERVTLRESRGVVVVSVCCVLCVLACCCVLLRVAACCYVLRAACCVMRVAA